MCHDLFNDCFRAFLIGRQKPLLQQRPLIFAQTLVPNAEGRALTVGDNHPLVNLILTEHVHLPLAIPPVLFLLVTVGFALDYGSHSRVDCSSHCGCYAITLPPHLPRIWD